MDYYTRLYSLADSSEVRGTLPKARFTSLTTAKKWALDKPYTNDVLLAQFVLEFFDSGILPRSTNDVLLVLLAKVAKPERITQFRPVSLCNVLFKIIMKMMVIRLKHVISKLIGPAQSIFIPGRLSIDNVVVVQEAVHSMRCKKGRKGWMLFKLDFEKAYDRISPVDFGGSRAVGGVDKENHEVCNRAGNEFIVERGEDYLIYTDMGAKTRGSLVSILICALP